MKSDFLIQSLAVFLALGVPAIDILLEPDATMLKRAGMNNARLLKVHPQGFTLDESHRLTVETATIDAFTGPHPKPALDEALIDRVEAE